MSPTFRRLKKLHKQAYAAFDAGELAQAAGYFAKLVKQFPDDSSYHYTAKIGRASCRERV